MSHKVSFHFFDISDTHLISFAPNFLTGASSDFSQATRVARKMVTELGMNDKVGFVSYNKDSLEKSSGDTKRLIESEIKQYLDVSASIRMGFYFAEFRSCIHEKFFFSFFLNWSFSISDV